MYSSPGTPTGTGCADASRARRAACSRSAGRAGPARGSCAKRCVDDQIVVSVGPYMLVRSPRGRPASSRGEAQRAAPRRRSSGADMPSSAAVVSGSSMAMRASDGVHCRCVTPSGGARAPRASASSRRSGEAGAVVGPRRELRVDLALEQSRGARAPRDLRRRHAEVDQAGDLVDADRAAAVRPCARHVSGVPNRPLVS